MTEPLSPRSGWGVLHLFFRVPDSADREAVVAGVKGARSEGYQVVIAALLGHKADLAVMVLGPDLWRLRALQTALVAAGLELAASYLSLTEVSEYAAGLPEERLRARLYPELPPQGLRAFCFYPMSKRRTASHNWYTLPFERRRELMMDHGAVGRRFAGRVLQLVTGSTGLDDYEWGVTLFAAQPDDLKDVVHTMRFDQASALYAEFGPFYAGMVAEVEEALALPSLAAGA
jgi:peroxiredoxin